MNYINLVKIAKNALMRNKFRAFLTMLGIIIGVASVIAMLAIGQGSKKSIQDQMSSMGSNLVFIMPGSQQRGGIQMGNSSSQALKLADVEAIDCSVNASWEADIIIVAVPFLAEKEIAKRIKEVASLWNGFMNYVIKKSENNPYISENVLDYDNYYKGSTVNNDIISFFKKK